jgi:hypothetical protein
MPQTPVVRGARASSCRHDEVGFAAVAEGQKKTRDRSHDTRVYLFYFIIQKTTKNPIILNLLSQRNFHHDTLQTIIALVTSHASPLPSASPAIAQVSPRTALQPLRVSVECLPSLFPMPPTPGHSLLPPSPAPGFPHCSRSACSLSKSRTSPANSNFLMARDDGGSRLYSSPVMT